MTYNVSLPLTGISGWKFLERTEEKQKAAFEKSVEIQRDVAYFTEKIGKVTSAADLVGDRRLLKVALGAFGLGDDIDKKALIRKVLEEGSTAEGALANKLSNAAYKKLSAAFGFGDTGGSQTAATGFAQTIVSQYKAQAFGAAVGEASETLGLALNFKNTIGELASTGKDGASWYTIMGSKGLRKVIEKAFGLPKSFSQIDVDKQKEILKSKSQSILGSDKVSVFKDPAIIEKVITRYLARTQIEDGPTISAGNSSALTLLQNASSSGSTGILNLLLSSKS
ncbi:MAG: DUF1217 domain-containing protein [Amaricoccus sp.]